MIAHVFIALLALAPSLLLGLTGYVTNSNGTTVSVFDTETKTVTGTITVGTNPAGVFVYGNYVYVANSGANTVSVIDRGTNTVVETITVDAQQFPSEPLYFTASGSYVYVSNQRGGPLGTGSIGVIDTRTNMLALNINDPGFAYPTGLVADGNYIYVANESSNPLGNSKVSVIDTRTNAVTDVIILGAPGDVVGAFAIAIKQNYVYVTSININKNFIYVIDTRTNTVVNTISDPSFHEPDAIVMDGDNGYVANGSSNTISVLDLETNTVTQVLDANPNSMLNGPTGLVIGGKYAYVPNYAANNVSILNLKTGELSTISDPFGTFNFPAGVAITTTLYNINRLQPLYQGEFSKAQHKLLDAGL